MKLYLLLLLVLFTFTAATCRGGGETGPYYVGTEGIRMRLEPGSPPHEVYYFSPAYLQGRGMNENVFDIVVELENVGSSWAKGGIYVTGFSPNFIDVEGQRPPGTGWSDCLWGDITNVNGDWTFSAGCRGTGGGYYQSDDNWFASGNLGGILRVIGAGDGPTSSPDDPWYLDIADGITVSGGASGGDRQVMMNFGFLETAYVNHGRLLLILSEKPDLSIDFDRNGVGREYVLQGDSPDFPGGEDNVVVMNSKILDFPLGVDELRQKLLITNCYLYTTYASPQICIDPVPYTEGRKVCRQETVDQTSTQGAPISISINKVKNTPQSVAFSVEVSDVGNGDVFSIGSAELCNPFHRERITSQDKNIVILGMVRIGPQELDCNSRVVRLDESGRGSVTCRYWHNNQFTSTSGFPTPVAVEAWYAYREVQERSMVVVRGD